MQTKITVENVSGEAQLGNVINNRAVASAINGFVCIDFEHTLKWIRFKPENAKKFAHDILSKVKEANKQLEKKKKK